MRVLFSSLPAYGHTYPLVPLALATREAGHEVLFATGESFHPSLKAFGLAAVHAGIGILEAVVEANGGNPPPDRANLSPPAYHELISAAFGRILPRAFLTDLGPVLERTKPDVVVHEAANAGAFFAAKLAGIPGICHGFGRAPGGPVYSAAAKLLTEFGRQIGVESPPGVFRGGGDLYLDLYPESLQEKDFLATTNRIPLRPVPVNEPGELPRSALSRTGERPLAYVTLGTVFGVVPVLRQAIAGLVALDMDVLVATGPSIDRRALGELPDNVEVQAWVPQAELLPHVDLVVHHGGSGTTLAALATGLPQLVLPQGADQFINAEAVELAGAGARLLGDDQSAEAVAATGKRLLADDDVRAAARAVAAEIAAMPSPEATVAVLAQR